MNIALQELNDYIANSLGEMLIEAEIRLDELIITVNRESIVDTLKFLRDDANCQFKQLMEEIWEVHFQTKFLLLLIMLGIYKD